ncbi:MAG TPA: DUF2071 domain-containing protein [Opitutaceae bacterium]|nr:DUF2071 domain-containing protein [Opitutaceae bacterium]
MEPPTLQQRLADRARPHAPVVLHQRWEQLLFLHWRWDAARVQATLPPGLFVDTFEGDAWLGLVPLFMRGVRPPVVPEIPIMSDFLELNLRTYVYDGLGRPGLYFYSLDCDQPLAVETAKRLLHLRYEHAAMTANVDLDGVVDFSSQRAGTTERAHFRYQAIGPGEEAKPESLEDFLAERYRLYSSDANGERLSTIRVCHPPYRLRAAIAFDWSDVPLRLAGFESPGRDPDHVRMADPQQVETFPPEKVE